MGAYNESVKLITSLRFKGDHRNNQAWSYIEVVVDTEASVLEEYCQISGLCDTFLAYEGQQQFIQPISTVCQNNFHFP